MRLCYVDESGDTRDLPTTPPHGGITPVLVVAGVVIDQRLLESVTREFIKLKTGFYPGLVRHSSHRLGRILPEIKGADLRRSLRQGARRKHRRQTMFFLDAFMDMLEHHDAKLFGRVWVKVIGGDCDDRSIYTFSVQAVCGDFQNLLESAGDDGLVIADSRSPTPNAAVAHSIFTQKFKTAGDRYPRILEMPTFGHSQNHAGLQVADLVCSAMLFPMATHAYCTGHVKNVHVDPGFGVLAERLGPRLYAMQHRYEDDHGRRRGGITVSDPVGRRGGKALFGPAGS
ncbi:MAG TPA: DUF3800 domain-containing protein [Solirubrobacteraceae bacterium]|nr:DUF3800 domain-containing protein [Solirubrobacteraceae bacterium]